MNYHAHRFLVYGRIQFALRPVYNSSCFADTVPGTDPIHTSFPTSPMLNQNVAQTAEHGLYFLVPKGFREHTDLTRNCSQSRFLQT
jgi:hypothetical protein